MSPDDADPDASPVYDCPRAGCDHRYTSLEAWEVHIIRHHYAKERDYRDPTDDPIAHKRVDAAADGEGGAS